MVVLKELSQILGLFRRPAAAGQPAGDALTAPLLDLLIDLRDRLRKEKNFGLADEIRNRLAELGVTLEDRPDGTRWRIEPAALARAAKQKDGPGWLSNRMRRILTPAPSRSRHDRPPTATQRSRIDPGPPSASWGSTPV